MDDEKIITLYMQRNEQAIAVTAEKYGGLCMKIVGNILKDEKDAEECVNDTYLGLWNVIPPQHPDSLTAFIAKIARNTALKKLRYNQAQKRSAVPTVSLTGLEELLADNRFADGVETREVVPLINAFLRTQKPEVRTVFVQRYWLCESVQEIAVRYAYSEGKVKSMLYHTRRKLQAYLEKEGIWQ